MNSLDRLLIFFFGSFLHGVVGFTSMHAYVFAIFFFGSRWACSSHHSKRVILRSENTWKLFFKSLALMYLACKYGMSYRS